jgi:hypothetical protein
MPQSYPQDPLLGRGTGHIATPPMPQPNRFSSNVSEGSYASDYKGNYTAPGVRPAARAAGGPTTGTATTGAGVFMWNDRDDDMDDALHTPDPNGKDERSHFDFFSARGWLNGITIFVLLAGLIMLFGGFPIIVHFRDDRKDEGSATSGFNLGGINSTGQVPQIGNFPSLIDPDTPQDAYLRKGFDGSDYTLAFSDEFNQAGRTFFPGDDPYWEGVDFHYWPTGDFEWYDPSAITTKDGHLVITMTEEPIHDLNFKSGMLQSWNKLCFSKGVYIEGMSPLYLDHQYRADPLLQIVSVSLPGTNDVGGFWPGVWTMGNLGRAGYGATTEGVSEGLLH